MRTNPLEVGAIDCSGLPGLELAAVELYLDAFFRIPVLDGSEHWSDADFHPQFFPKFSLEAIGVGFPRFEFSSWKLPESAQVLVGWALGNEELSCAKYQSRGNRN